MIIYKNVQTLNSTVRKNPFGSNYSLLGWVSESFKHLDQGSLSYSSRQILSSYVRIDGKCLWTAIFKFLPDILCGLSPL